MDGTGTCIGTGTTRADISAGSGQLKDRSLRLKVSAMLAVTALAAALPLLSACNTTEGAGKDLRAAGSGIANSAEKNQSY